MNTLLIKIVAALGLVAALAGSGYVVKGWHDKAIEGEKVAQDFDAYKKAMAKEVASSKEANDKLQAQLDSQDTTIADLRKQAARALSSATKTAAKEKADAVQAAHKLTDQDTQVLCTGNAGRVQLDADVVRLLNAARSGVPAASAASGSDGEK